VPAAAQLGSAAMKVSTGFGPMNRFAWINESGA
jgi:hypothetical protein